MKYSQMKASDLVCVNVAVKDSAGAIQIIKNQKIMEFDENTYAKLPDVNFHDGTIKVNVLSRLLPDAPEFARGFIGIAFRINEDDTAFESFYVRPTNGRIGDVVRLHRACQYFSYPRYTFDYFRRNNILKYENAADIGLNEWITLKADIKGSHGMFFVNDMENPVLDVLDMKLGDEAKGSVGIFVDIGTEGYFKDLEVLQNN